MEIKSWKYNYHTVRKLPYHLIFSSILFGFIEYVTIVSFLKSPTDTRNYKNRKIYDYVIGFNWQKCQLVLQNKIINAFPNNRKLGWIMILIKYKVDFFLHGNRQIHWHKNLHLNSEGYEILSTIQLEHNFGN